MNNKLFKRVLSMAVVVVMVMTMLPTVFAADPYACPAHTSTTEWTEVAEGTWTGGTLESGHYKLTGSQTLASALTVAEGATVCIDLAGYKITAEAALDNAYRAFEVYGELTVLDSTGVFNGIISGGHMEMSSDNVAEDVHIYGGNILVSGANAKMNLYGGVISGGYMNAKTYKYHTYGGNIGVIEGATLNVYDGLIENGSITMNQQATYYHGGGNVYATDSTVNIYGGEIKNGDVTARYSSGSANARKSFGVGGNIAVVDGTLNIEGGTIDNGNLDVRCNASSTSATPSSTCYAHGGNIYAIGSTVTISDAIISNGTLSGEAVAVNGGTCNLEAHGGNLYFKTSTVTISGNTQILDGEVVNDNTSARGGNMMVGSSSVVTMESGVTLSGGTCATGGARGGNAFVIGTLNINGSTISGGTAGWGANLMLQSNATINLNGGTISGGTGDESVLVQRGTFNMSAGTIENTAEGVALSVQGTADTNGGKAYITGGTVGDVFMNRASSLEVSGGTIGKATLVHTANLDIKAGATVTKMWDAAETAAVTVAEGVICRFNPALNEVPGFEAYLMDKSTGVTTYTVYTKLDTALNAAQAGNTVTLMSDVTAGAVVVPANVTLNLYNRTLTADSVSAQFEGAQIKDSKTGTSGVGKIVSDSVSVMADNGAFLPIAVEDGYIFEEVTFAENLSVDTKGYYKFYIDGLAEDTKIDDAILTGDATIEIYVTWTNGNNEPKNKTFTLDANLLAEYAGAWDTKMITLTINDLTNVTDLTCTAQVVANGVTVNA